MEPINPICLHVGIKITINFPTHDSKGIIIARYLQLILTPLGCIAPINLKEAALQAKLVRSFNNN